MPPALTPVMQANKMVGEIDWEANLRALYYDLAGAHSPETIRMMLTITTPDHLLYGSDYPYVAPQVLTQSLARMKDYLSKESDLALFREMIFTENARKLWNLSLQTDNNIFNHNMEQPTFESLNSPWLKGEPNTGYAQYFIGNSYLAQMEGGFVNVTFEPRCRNNWHIHHKQVQVLICVAGRGWYQEWGKEPVEMTPGTVIAIPAEVKHWHGAAKDSWFQHLTYHKDVQDGASNEWLEPVTDDIYDILQ